MKVGKLVLAGLLTAAFAVPVLSFGGTADEQADFLFGSPERELHIDVEGIPFPIISPREEACEYSAILFTATCAWADGFASRVSNSQCSDVQTGQVCFMMHFLGGGWANPVIPGIPGLVTTHGHEDTHSCTFTSTAGCINQPWSHGHPLAPSDEVCYTVRTTTTYWTNAIREIEVKCQ